MALGAAQSMKLISNIGTNHLSQLRELLAVESDRFVIVSPFLSQSMGSFLSEVDFSKLKRLDLITTFKPEDLEQLSKPYQLKSFLEYFAHNAPALDVRIHIDNQLHGKMYLRVTGQTITLLLSSANFTFKGMIENHEWGLLTEDQDTAQRALEEAYGAIEFPEISRLQIAKACEFADHYRKLNPSWTVQPKVHVDILTAVYSDVDKSNHAPKYFLKPIGESEDPVLLEDKQDFSALHQNLHFSKKKPTGVMKGDVVITTAVGPGSLLSYFRVTGTLRHVTEEEIAKDDWKRRWPWYLEGRNQSPAFGASWWTHNLRRQDLLEEFRNLHPEIPVTAAGGFTLGTLNMGNDKVLITREFAEFLIDRIDAANLG
jgi:HKD family nuclease